MAFSQGDIETPMMPPQYVFEMCMPLIQENKDSTFSFIHVSVKDHLKSAESAMALKEAYALCEHSVASITCLLAGFRIFDTTYDSNERDLKILRGLHGFHIYATEYWLEDLLCSSAAICDDHQVVSVLYSTAKALADRLNTASLSAEISTEQESDILDTRLDRFANQGAVYNMLRSALRERSTKATSDPTKQETFSAEIIRLAPQNLKDLLASYQASIRSLLMIPSFTGITFEELEKFKREFRTAAFTCRVPNCPRAAAGFTDEKKLSEHERTHTQRIVCTVPDCQYPPLTSSRALRVHLSKCHGKTQQIAKMTRISTPQLVRATGRLHRADGTDGTTEGEYHGLGGPATVASQLNFARQQQEIVRRQQFNMNNPSARMAAIRQQQLYQQQQRQAILSQQFPDLGAAGVNGMPMGTQLSPQQLHQLRQRDAAAGLGHVAGLTPQEILAQQYTVQKQLQGNMQIQAQMEAVQDTGRGMRVKQPQMPAVPNGQMPQGPMRPQHRPTGSINGEQFMKNLTGLMNAKGLTLDPNPMIGDRLVNLMFLFQAVRQRGGSKSVTFANGWGHIAQAMGLPAQKPNVPFSLKQIYERNLSKFEEVWIAQQKHRMMQQQEANQGQMQPVQQQQPPQQPQQRNSNSFPSLILDSSASDLPLPLQAPSQNLGRPLTGLAAVPTSRKTNQTSKWRKSSSVVTRTSSSTRSSIRRSHLLEALLEPPQARETRRKRSILSSTANGCN
ncbi:hypothetical protein TrVFT333_011263 [Trichoderma virens FT-333]|nr:hypothetical protein TrVFT333_011263 [Trichoderma virens FT-333]